MIIVSTHWTDLIQGYQRVLRLDAALPPGERRSADLINSWKHRLAFPPRNYSPSQHRVKPASVSLRDDLPIRKVGDGGENQLINSLSASLDDSFFALQGLLISNHLDVDVLVLGPTGIWVLESKDWSGAIIVREGKWYRQKWGFSGPSAFNQKQDRYGLPQNLQKIKAFDQQWILEKAAVERAVRAAGFSVNGFKHSSLVRGGLVFTHPRLQLDFDGSCQADYGDVQKWVRDIKSGRVLEVLKEENIVSLMDGLLRSSASIKTPQGGCSSSAVAEQLYRDVLDTLA